MDPMPDREKMMSAADPALEEVGRRGMVTCLGATGDDVVTIVADEANLAVGAAFLAAADVLGARANAFVIEEHCPRPMTKFTEKIMSVLGSSTVTVLAQDPQPGELKARLQIIDLVPEKKLRHAHLVSVSVEALRRGMRADYEAIDVLQDRIRDVLEEAGSVQVYSQAGTSLEARFTTDHNWVKSNGLIKPGFWQNLPSGQLYTCPASVEGVYVADRTVGDWFESRFPDLSEHPVTLEISAGRVRNAACDNKRLAREISMFLRSSENGDRVGEVGFGTNPFLTFMVGQMTNNEDVPGVHLSMGNPIAQKTGAGWTSKVKLPFAGASMSYTAGGTTLMEEGRFAPDLLEGLSSLQSASDG
jgi:leucyl aminopeptidase (aminopeptidase T)